MPSYQQGNPSIRAPRTKDFRERQRYEEQVKESSNQALTGGDADILNWMMYDVTAPQSTASGDSEDVRLAVEMLHEPPAQSSQTDRAVDDLRVMVDMIRMDTQKLEDLTRRVADNEILMLMEA